MLIAMRTAPRIRRPGIRRAQPADAARIEAALLKVAAHVTVDPAFAPIFERLEAELAMAVKEETLLGEAQRRARALLA